MPISSLIRRLDRIERAALPTLPSVPPVNPRIIAFERVCAALAIAGLGNPRPDEPLRLAWARVVDIVDHGRGWSPHLIAAIGAFQAYPDPAPGLDKLRDATNTMPAWLDAFASVNLARAWLDWPLRDVVNEAEPMTPAAALDQIESRPGMPGSAYLGDFADDDARARWDAICGTVCDRFALIPASRRLTPGEEAMVEQMVPVGRALGAGGPLPEDELSALDDHFPDPFRALTDEEFLDYDRLSEKGEENWTREDRRRRKEIMAKLFESNGLIPAGTGDHGRDLLSQGGSAVLDVIQTLRAPKSATGDDSKQSAA